MHCFISELETPQLVALYKNVTGKEVKKFETRKAGIKRVGKALAEKYDTEFASNGTCVYAPAGMAFDMEALDFVDKDGGAVQTIEDRVDEEHAYAEGDRDEQREAAESVDDKIRGAKVTKKATKPKGRAKKESGPVVQSADDPNRVVKTSGAPVRKAGGSPAKGRRLGIGKRMEQLLAEDVLPKNIVEKIREEFPSSRCTTKDVYLIRSRMNEAA